MTDWPDDPDFDWPQHFRAGDVVRLDDGRVAVVTIVLDYAPNPPPSRWGLVVTALGAGGVPDDFITEPWKCRREPEAADEARRQGLL